MFEIIFCTKDALTFDGEFLQGKEPKFVELPICRTKDVDFALKVARESILDTWKRWKENGYCMSTPELEARFEAAPESFNFRFVAVRSKGGVRDRVYRKIAFRPVH